MSHQSQRQAVLPDSGGIEEKLGRSSSRAMPSTCSASRRRSVACSHHQTMSRQVGIRSRSSATRSGSGGSAAIRRALGQWIQVEQKDYQIVGVAQAGFTGAQPGRAHGCLASQHDVSARVDQRSAVELVAGLGSTAARGHARHCPAHCRDDARELRVRLAAPGKAQGEQAAELAIDVVDAVDRPLAGPPASSNARCSRSPRSSPWSC